MAADNRFSDLAKCAVEFRTVGISYQNDRFIGLAIFVAGIGG